MSINEKNQGTMENAETKLAWVDLLAAKVSECTGHHLGTDHVHSDETGWYYYIKEKSLKANHPLLMNHYRGPLFAVIPMEDYDLLKKGELDPVAYVDNAMWSYGYYWGGGAMIGGAFWQPLEAGPGIHDKEKISRYLTILRCRTFSRASGYRAAEEECQRCNVNDCPFSKYAIKNANADWANEVQEYDYRTKLFEAVINRVEEELLLKVCGIYCYTGNNALLIPNERNLKTCSLYLPVEILNDLLYNPGERDWTAIAAKYTFELGVMMDSERILVEQEELTVTAAQFCRNFWAAFNYSDNEAKDAEFEEVEEGNWFEKLKVFFRKIFKISK